MLFIGHKGKLHEKKVAVLLDFVEMRGEGREGPAQIVCPLFTTVYWVNLGMGMERGRPLPNFFGTLAL